MQQAFLGSSVKFENEIMKSWIKCWWTVEQTNETNFDVEYLGKGIFFTSRKFRESIVWELIS